MKTIKELKFRPITQRHFILVTDDRPFTSLNEWTIDDVIATSSELDIHVNVLGLPSADHQRLAAETGGKWHAIPQDP